MSQYIMLHNMEIFRYGMSEKHIANSTSLWAVGKAQFAF